MPLDQRFLQIADRLLQLIREETSLDTIVCDENGAIVRATLPSRAGGLHAGSQKIMRSEAHEYFVTAEEARADPLLNEGQNCPIVVGGRRVGTIGIAAPLEPPPPLARVAAVLLAHGAEEIQPEGIPAPAGLEQRRRARGLFVHASPESWERVRQALHERYDLLQAGKLSDALVTARR